ncbi:MAG: hypothetical protein QM783_19135 [Phycisphaerales bacterium]
MPVWLERLVLRNVGVEYLPALACVGLAVAVWWWQWSRRARRKAAGREETQGRAVRVGWGPGMAVVALVVLGVAAFAVMTGLGQEAWWLVLDNPWLAAWWVVGIGVAVAVWGIAVHAWRGEARLARQCRCGYDMTAVVGMRCPECGRQAKSERQLRPFNVRRWAVWVAALTIAAGLLLPTGVAAWRRGWPAILPSRTLLWWMTSTSNPPGPVLREIMYRGGDDPGWWSGQVQLRCVQLAERMMECGPEASAEYAAVLRSVMREVGDPRFMTLILDNLKSSDPARRRNAATLLVAFGGWGAPLSSVEALLADPDPSAQANGRMLITAAAGEIVQRLTGADGKPAEADPARVRVLVRLLCDMPLNSYYGAAAQLDPLCSSTDPEVAARASIVRNRWLGSLASGTSVSLKAALLGTRTLRELKQPPVPGGVSIATFLWRPEGASEVGKLIEDPDLAVRSELLAEIDGATATMTAYFAPGNTTYWDSLLGFMRAQAQREPDAELKALLEKVVARIEGKPEQKTAP